jgi:SAM-dependent methyltransferase
MTDLREVARNLTCREPGFWVARNHEDMQFIASDKTDWLAVEQASFWYRHRNRVLLGIVNLYPPRGTLFEIGAGNGSVTMALQKAGYSVVGIEPTVRFAENARRRGVQTVVCATIEDAGFEPGSLPNAAMFDVLEHIPSDAQYLVKLRQLIRAGGRLYCSVPALQWLWSREDEEAEHVRRYTIDALARSLTAAGFRVEHSTYFFRALLGPIFIMRSIPSLVGLRPKRTPESSLREHVLPRGWVSRCVERLLDREASRIEAGKQYAVGASCVIVARAI